MDVAGKARGTLGVSGEHAHGAARLQRDHREDDGRLRPRRPVAHDVHGPVRPRRRRRSHDHPFEETYLFLEGGTDATFDGETYRSGVGTSRWAGTGCVHSLPQPGGRTATLAGDAGAATASTPLLSVCAATGITSGSSREALMGDSVVIGGHVRDRAARSARCWAAERGDRGHARPGRRRAGALSPTRSAGSPGSRSTWRSPPTRRAAGRRRAGRPARARRDRSRPQHRRRLRPRRARRLVTMKLVGYTEVDPRAPAADAADDAAIVLFGGLAKDRPYPGSTTVSTVNGGVIGMVHSLADRAGADPGQRASTPASWVTARSGRASRWSLGATGPGRRAAGWRRWPTSRTPSSSCWRNPAVNGVDLHVDGGTLVT